MQQQREGHAALRRDCRDDRAVAVACLFIYLFIYLFNHHRGIYIACVYFFRNAASLNPTKFVAATRNENLSSHFRNVVANSPRFSHVERISTSKQDPIEPDPDRISLLSRYSTDTRFCNNDEIRGATVLGREKRGEEKGIGTFRRAEIMSKYANRLLYTRLRALNWRAETGTRARRAEGERRARRETSR